MGHKSATTSLSKRKRDRYKTPPGWPTEVLLSLVPDIDGILLEPCSGTRSISRVLEDHLQKKIEADQSSEKIAAYARLRLGHRSVLTNDLDGRYKADWHLDMLDPGFWKLCDRRGPVDWTITNPPFNQAAEFLPMAYKHSRLGVALLLRLTYLEPVENPIDRGAWLHETPPQKEIVLPRQSFKTVITDLGDGKFRKSKTDSVTVAWYVWRKDKRVDDRPIEIIPRSWRP